MLGFNMTMAAAASFAAANNELAYDPYWDNVAMLITADTGSIVDIKGNCTINLVGSPTINTTVQKYGVGAVALGGAGNYIYTTANAAQGIGAGDYTTEGWFRATSISLFSMMDLRTVGGPANQTKPFVYFASNQLRLNINNVNVIAAAWVPTLGVYYHVAVSRISGVTRLFLNGNLMGTYNGTQDFGTTGQFTIGTVADSVGSGSWPYNGYFDDVRLTIGIGRYASGFTPVQAKTVGP